MARFTDRGIALTVNPAKAKRLFDNFIIPDIRLVGRFLEANQPNPFSPAVIPFQPLAPLRARFRVDRVGGVLSIGELILIHDL
jgi:hypothetical protein